MSPQQFTQKLLSWFDEKGRKDLPWQQAINPYRIWLSEIMLQQTQVTTVIPYFNAFIKKFPDIQSLAQADEESVLCLWSGLGYYARARNLHKTAKIISQKKGEFPNDLTALMELPGIGRSTAGAILSIAFKQAQPILDGNVRRVFARFHALHGWPGASNINKALWRLSEQYTPIKRCADYTQAIMDLGATLCKRSKPLCELCPVSEGCQAKAQNIVDLLPTPKPSKSLPVKKTIFLILQNMSGQTCLEKRPTSGIWGGLWSFPEFTSIQEIQSWCAIKKYQTHKIQVQAEKGRHTFSHFHLDYQLVTVIVDIPLDSILEMDRMVWYNSEQIKTLGLPTPVKRLLKIN